MPTVSMFPRAIFSKPTVIIPILIVKSCNTALTHLFLNKATNCKFDFCNKFSPGRFGIIDFRESNCKFIYLIS